MNLLVVLNVKGDFVVVWEQNIVVDFKGGQFNGNLVGNFFLLDLIGVIEEIVVVEMDVMIGMLVEVEVSIDDDDDIIVVYMC